MTISIGTSHAPSARGTHVAWLRLREGGSRPVAATEEPAPGRAVWHTCAQDTPSISVSSPEAPPEPRR